MDLFEYAFGRMYTGRLLIAAENGEQLTEDEITVVGESCAQIAYGINEACRFYKQLYHNNPPIPQEVRFDGLPIDPDSQP